MTTTTEDQTYNGWVNYSTWGVALVLDNEENTYLTVHDAADQMRASIDKDENVREGIWTPESALRFRLADWLKDYAELLCGLGEDDEPSTMARQMIAAGMADVDWHEIADHVLAE